MKAVKMGWESRKGKAGVVRTPCKGRSQVGERFPMLHVETCDNIQVLLNIYCAFKHKGTCEEAQVREFFLVHFLCLFYLSFLHLSASHYG